MRMDEDFYLCWSDITGAIRKRFRFIGWSALICSALFFGYALFSTPLFFCQAVFHEKGKSVSLGSGASALMTLSGIGGTGGNGTQSTLSIMESRRLAEIVVARMGLQISMQPEGKTWRLLKNLKDNVLSEFAFWADRPSGAAVARTSPIVFRDVNYEGLYPYKFSLTVGKRGAFTLESRVGKVSGQIGNRMEYGDISFIVESTGPLIEGESIQFVAEPKYKVLNKFKRSLSVKLGKRKDGTLAIGYAHPSPREAQEVANALMYEYLKLIKSDAQKITTEQLRFLAQTQEKTWSDLEFKFDEHAAFAQQGITEGGYVRAKEGIKMLSKAYADAENSLRELQSEETSLQVSDPVLVANSHPLLRTELSQMNGKLHELNRRQNTLRLALSESVQDSELIKSQVENLEKEEQLRSALNQLVSGANIEQVTVESPTFKRALSPWLSSSFNSHQKQLFHSYLNSLIQASKLRSRIYEASMQMLTKPATEIQGLGLGPATQNYERGLSHLQELELEGASLKQALDQLSLDDFDVGALLDTLNLGGNFRQIAKECHTLHFELKDSKSYSLKERRRMDAQLQSKLIVLKDHLSHVCKMNQHQQMEARGQVHRAQKTLLSLVCQEIALVEEEMCRAIEQRRMDLQKEIGVCRNTLTALKEQMSQLPKALLREKKLDMETAFQSELMQALVGLIESRQLSQSLDIVESKPLDTAQFPIRPKAPGLILWAVVGGAFGLCMGSVYALSKAAFMGFVATPDNLRVRGQFVAGGLRASSLASQEEERRRALLFAEKEALALVGVTERELCALVESLTSQGYRVSVVAQCGVLKDFEGAALHPIDRLDRSSIQRACEELKSNFDKILIYSPSSASSLEGEYLARLDFDTLVYLKGERVRELTSYLELAKRSRVAFVFSSSL